MHYIDYFFFKTFIFNLVTVIHFQTFKMYIFTCVDRDFIINKVLFDLLSHFNHYFLTTVR